MSESSPELLRELRCTNCGAALIPTAQDQRLIACGYCGRSYAIQLPPFVLASKMAEAQGPVEAPAPPVVSPEVKPVEAPPAKAPAGAPPSGGKYAPGDAVRIRYNSTWYDGKVLRRAGPSSWEVSYDGWDASWNEVVGPGRLQALAGAPRARRDAAPLDLKPGQAVEVLYNTVWYPATVLSVGADTARIHYTEYSDSWDEDVPWDRLRAQGSLEGVDAQAWQGSLEPGTPLEVKWGGTWYDGRVVSVHGDSLRVHYDGYGDSWDEDVPWDRVRPRS
ncbi:MAG: hypothetical protein HY909_21905 [Deltaproteobacteria bacterium]|nr:hypothetical protein [Deltaproteobacteria bacterium]